MELIEVPLGFVLAPASYERKAFSSKGLNVPFYELNFGPHRIWGATAGMLRALYDRLYGAAMA